MIQSNMAPQGMAVTPHHLASESALAVLRDGGNAIEAMVAAASTIAVVYPHMNGLGGDGFWLIMPPGGDPVAIDASGAAGSLAHFDFYGDHQQIPHRGPKAALTVAGTVSGWHEALQLGAELGTAPLPLARLLRDAIRYAADGIPVTASQTAATATFRNELQHQPGFAATFMPDGDVPQPGSRFTQPALAQTLCQLTEQGLDSFYRGPLARHLASEMSALGMPITLEDLQQQRARRCTPLHLSHSEGDIWNMTPPTQGMVSLAILGITDALDMADASEAQTVHRIVEATKKAFALRDKHITDPRHITEDLHDNVSSLSRFSLANRWTVRGFDGENSLQDNKGWYWRIDISWIFPDKAIQPYIGVDAGQVYGHQSQQYYNGKTVIGSVVGLRGKYQQTYLDLFSGTPLKKPQGFHTDPLTLGFSLQWKY